ncbi:transcription antitermination protein NusB [Rickettsiales bacterium]|nr:transcription antitermination protein NusB [Rickettsiales bacterium]
MQNSNLRTQDKNVQEKKVIFENALTYRRRMSRICAVQSMYVYDVQNIVDAHIDNKTLESITIVPTDIQKSAEDICESVLYHYRNSFFSKEYITKDPKKSSIDAKYLHEIIFKTLSSLKYIDEIISKYINEKWSIDKLEIPIRAILRCAICEILNNSKTETSILTSEYTNTTSHFFNGKQIGFVNGIIDKIAKTFRK